ncbi:hypothetical protein L3X38_042229 [Prunus dulcis]|uniref:Uncharacterized protein n=1 Tax=Prunus dulcis TaxID=3755 RepID=A0AAD4UUG1_PRUDU|nr:hypothetical protein L3X38_042229 [Prunus dulcis]
MDGLAERQSPGTNKLGAHLQSASTRQVALNKRNGPASRTLHLLIPMGPAHLPKTTKGHIGISMALPNGKTHENILKLEKILTVSCLAGAAEPALAPFETPASQGQDLPNGMG